MAWVPDKEAKIEIYIRQWLATIGSHLDVVFAWGTGVDPFQRMQIRCKKCNQTLTSNVPQDAEKIDWALQKFGNLHAHKQASGLTTAIEGTIPEYPYASTTYTISAVLQDAIKDSQFAKTSAGVLQIGNGTQGDIRAVTQDFKPVTMKPRPLTRKEGRRFREDI